MPEDPTLRHRERVRALGRAVLEGEGVVSPDTRLAAATHDGVADPFAPYVDAIHRHAFRITNATVAGLLASGASQDEVFEMTVSAAYGAALERFEAGLGALRAALGDD